MDKTYIYSFIEHKLSEFPLELFTVKNYYPGVFTTFRSYFIDDHSIIYALPEHCKRIIQHAQSFHNNTFTKKLTYETVYNFALEMLKENNSSIKNNLKCRIIITSNNIYLTAEKCFTNPNPLSLCFYNNQRTLPELKHCDLEICEAARSFAKNNNFDDALFVSKNNFVQEASYANIFWVKNNQLFTNSKDILHGITRNKILSMYPCAIEEITTDKLLESDEIFLTQNTNLIIPVKKIETKKFSTIEVTHSIKKLLENDIITSGIKI